MNIIEAIIFGLVQGLTEFIPVSSSGHLVLLHEIFGSSSLDLAFDVALHGGTLLALIVFFYQDLTRLAKGIFKPGKDRALALLLLAATIPAAVAGYVLEDQAESTFRSARLVALNLILVAGLMLLAEWKAGKTKHPTKLPETRLSQALGVGLAQALAIVPGVSRSGSTITAGLFMGMERVAATRFAFLLGIPIIGGALLKTMLDGGLAQAGDHTGIFVAGALSAFVSGLFAIKFLISFLGKHSLAVFAYYRVALGLVVLFLA